MKKYPNNNLWLNTRVTMLGLRRQDVADALHVSKSTIDRWLVPKTKEGKPNPTWRPMPDMARELMKYRLKDNWFST